MGGNIGRWVRLENGKIGYVVVIRENNQSITR